MIDQLSWLAIYPELILLVMACVILLVDLGVKSAGRGLTYGLTLLTLGLVVVVTASQAAGGQTIYGFGRMVVSEPMGNWLKCFAALALMATVVYGRPYAKDRDMLRGGEFFTLSMFSLLGAFIMISGHNFLVLYMGLEMMTLSSHGLSGSETKACSA
jgi:NADH-quinone oxidoreductase subunit N